MKIGLPTDGSFQTIDGIKFVCRNRENGLRVTWDGGIRGGKITQFAEDENEDTDRFRATSAGDGRRYKTLLAAARASIKEVKERVDLARELVALYDAEA